MDGIDKFIINPDPGYIHFKSNNSGFLSEILIFPEFNLFPIIVTLFNLKKIRTDKYSY